MSYSERRPEPPVLSDSGWSCLSAPERLAASDTSEYTRFFAQGDKMIAGHGQTFRLPEGPQCKTRNRLLERGLLWEPTSKKEGR